jgi:hypothetical protein
MSADSPRRTIIEQIEVAGDQLLERIMELVREGNVRRIRIKHDGHEVLEIPVTLAVVGGLISPVLAAIGAFAAVATHCTIEVVREVPDPPAGPPATTPPPGA